LFAFVLRAFFPTMHRPHATTYAKPKIAVIAATEPERSSAPVICAASLGVAAAWVAAGASGLLSHGLRHAIAWVLLLLVTALAWPHRTGWREKSLVLAAAVGAVLLTASPIVTLNVLAVTLLLGALSQVQGPTSEFQGHDSILLIAAQATGVLALFQFAQNSIATFWHGTNAAAEAVGAVGGALSGQPLNIGPSLAGLDFLIVGVAILTLLALERRIRVTGYLIAVAVMLLGHLAYLALLAQSEQILIAANTMRAERLFNVATSVEREQLLGAIKFEPQPDENPIPGLSEQDVAARRAAEKKKFDAELASLGLERSDLAEISESLKEDAVFPDWVDAGVRGKLYDRLKAPLEQLEQQRLFGPATRLPYTFDGFLLNVVPWNLPAVALVFHTALVGVVFWIAFGRRAVGRRGGDLERGRGGDSVGPPVGESPTLPLSHCPPLVIHPRWLVAIAAVAILLPLASVFSRGFGTYQGKKIVAYEKGFLNWLRPEYGNMLDNMNYGRLSVGMYGMAQPFVESLGMKFMRSKNLAAEDLEDADVLVMFYPNRRWRRSQVERIYDFVERGGALLVAGEHTIFEAKKKPGSIVYPGEEEDQELEPGDEWVGEEEGNRVNDLIDHFNMQIAFDSAEFAVGGWLQSYFAISHPTTTGLRDERNTFGAVVGATVEAPWPARPMIMGRYGIGDLGDYSKSDTGSYMGDSRYNAGERLGDIVLAVEKPVGRGRVILFGDTSGFTNNLTVSGHPFTARLYAYLASNGAGNPQAMWRQAIGGMLLAAAVGFLFWFRQPTAVLVFAVCLGGALATFSYLTAEASEVLPRGVTYTPPPDLTMPNADAAAAAKPTYRGPNNLAYIDGSHHSAASDESLRPDGIMGLTYMLMRHNYLALLLPELTGERLMDHPDRRDASLGVESLKARLLVSIAPQRAYSERELIVLDEYIARGGRLILTVGADDAAPVTALLGQFKLNVGLYGSSTAYGIAGQARDTGASAGPMLLGQQPREPTPLGHFKSEFPARPPGAVTEDYVHFSNDLGPYTAFVRFHAGWPVSSADPKALTVARYEPDLPLAIVKRHGAGLVALIGDSGFAMNKNLEREDGSPIEGMRENAFFWRWLLDLLEHEEETWIPPAVQATVPAPDPVDEMLKSLQIPELKVDRAVPPPAGEPEPLPNEEEVKGPVLINPDEKSTDKAAEPAKKEEGQ
jgi:hypothetical protein